MIPQEIKQTTNINGHLHFQWVSGKVRLTHIMCPFADGSQINKFAPSREKL